MCFLKSVFSAYIRRRHFSFASFCTSRDLSSVSNMAARTFSITIKQDLREARDTFEDLDIEAHKLRYVYFQEEQETNENQAHLQGMIQFEDRKSVRQVMQLFDVLGLKDVHIEKARNVNGLYECVRKKRTRIADGITIEKGCFQGSGSSKQGVDGSGARIIRYTDVVEYFNNGGSPNQITSALGPNVLKIPFRNIHNELIATQEDANKKERILKAEEWWKESAYQWQKIVRATLEYWAKEEQDTRILVIYDPSGKRGKTEFCEQLQKAYPEHSAHVKKTYVGKMSLQLKKYNPMLKFCMVDYKDGDYTKYDNEALHNFLESLKEGKVESITKFLNVQIVVMIKNPLDWSLMTGNEHMWCIMELIEGKKEPRIKEWTKKDLNAIIRDSLIKKYYTYAKETCV